MAFKIKYKIFLSIFILLLAAVGGMVLLLQESFDRTFLQYVNKYEREAQNNLIVTLAELYKTHRDWEFIRDDEQQWNSLVVSNFARTKSSLQQDHRDRQDPAGTVDKDTEKEMKNRMGDRFYRSNMALLDADRRHIVGRQIEHSGTEFKPITVNSQLAGYLAARPLARILERSDVEFSNQQVRAFKIIAVAMAVLTFIMSIPLARYLVTRINVLANGTRELSSGNYAVRISDTSNDEFGKLSGDFNLLAKTLEKNEKARRQWIADISHELRTPLSILRGEIEAIQDKVRSMTPETLNNLHNEVLNLDRLVRDLYELSMSDIGALSYHKRKINPVDILEQSISIYRDEFDARNIALELIQSGKRNILVLADEDRLRQLFSNLLTNSLRYTEQNGRLEILVTEKTDSVEIRFNDSAPSVSADDMPRLFDRLYRIESSRSRATGGTGLGLAICKNIVDAHQGQIVAAQSPYGGLQITIVLPLV